MIVFSIVEIINYKKVFLHTVSRKFISEPILLKFGSEIDTYRIIRIVCFNHTNFSN